MRKSPAFSPQSPNPDGSSPSSRHNAKGRAAYEEPATYNTVANITDGMGNGVIEIT
jgi:hypothetical protein